MSVRALFLSIAATIILAIWLLPDHAHSQVDMLSQGSSATAPERPELRRPQHEVLPQNPGRSATRQMRAQPNVSGYIEGTDVNSSDIYGTPPPGKTQYDYPYCCSIHCSC